MIVVLHGLLYLLLLRIVEVLHGDVDDVARVNLRVVVLLPVNYVDVVVDESC